MSNTWFRMYSEFSNDPKVQSMPEHMQRRLVMLFCLRCSDVTVTLEVTEIAFALRISDEELSETKALFLRKGFINDQWEIANWDKRQFSSDSSAERTRAYRERKKKSDVTVARRHSDALDTDTDTEYKTQTNAQASATEISLANISVDDMKPWIDQQAVSGNPIIVDIRQELEKFRTHYLAYGGKDGAGKVPASWVAMFGKWLLKANVEKKIGGSGEKTRGNQSRSVATSSNGGGSPGAGDKPTWKSEGERLAAAFLSGEKK